MNIVHLLDVTILPNLLEAGMLVCFGIAWPLANLRMLRTRRAEGKGLGFTLVILCGYLFGATAKLMLAQQGDPLPMVFWLYALNGCSVGVNLGLQWRFKQRVVAQEGTPRAAAWR